MNTVNPTTVLSVPMILSLLLALAMYALILVSTGKNATHWSKRWVVICLLGMMACAVFELAAVVSLATGSRM